MRNVCNDSSLGCNAVYMSAYAPLTSEMQLHYNFRNAKSSFHHEDKLEMKIIRNGCELGYSGVHNVHLAPLMSEMTLD